MNTIHREGRRFQSAIGQFLRPLSILERMQDGRAAPVPAPYSRSIWVTHFNDPMARTFIHIRILSSFLFAAYVLLIAFPNAAIGWFPTISLAVYIVIPTIATVIFLRRKLPYWSMMVHLPAYGLFVVSNTAYAMFVLDDAARAMLWVPWLITMLIEVTIWFDNMIALVIMTVPTIAFIGMTVIFLMPIQAGHAQDDMLLSCAFALVAAIALLYLTMNFRKHYASSLAQAESAAAAAFEAAEKERITLKLMTTQLELERLNRNLTMSALAASIAHEINQPLAALVANAGAGLRWMEGGEQGEARAAFSRVVEDGHRAAEVIASMRMLMRKRDPNHEPVDVNHLLREVVKLLAVETKGRGASILLELDHTLPIVVADRVRLQQVCINLIANALDAMDNVYNRDRVITIASGLANGDIFIRVSDTGEGVSGENQGRIFDPFFSTKAQGTGMGLAICKSIVESHGGDLTMVSGPQGSSFVVTLRTEGRTISEDPAVAAS